MRYLVVGGYAVNFHGHVRTTGDLDVWAERTVENAERLVRVFREFGLSNPTPDLFLDPKNLLRMGVPPMRIEVLVEISGVTFEDCYAEREQRTWGDLVVPILSLERLKQAKRAAGRLKDLADVEQLERVHRVD